MKRFKVGDTVLIKGTYERGTIGEVIPALYAVQLTATETRVCSAEALEHFYEDRAMRIIRRMAAGFLFVAGVFSGLNVIGNPDFSWLGMMNCAFFFIMGAVLWMWRRL